MFGIEIRKALHRPRTYVLGACLIAVAIIPVLSLASGGAGGGSANEGPPFLNMVQHSGMIGALAALVIMQPHFLPVGAGLLSGEAVSQEASWGTLRYLLVRPVGRIRFVLLKYAAVMFQLALAMLLVTVVGLVAGGIAFGFGPMPTLSGSTLAVGAALVRILFAWIYVFAGVAGLCAIGMFLSTLTDSAPAAVVATVGIAITSQLLDSISKIRWLHPYLFSHNWLAFADLFRSPIYWNGIIHGFWLAAAYTTVFLALTVWRFSRKDINS